MIFDQPIEHMTSLFAEQFLPDGNDYLYRRQLTAAPVRVTNRERDDFVATFRRQARISFWATSLGLLLLTTILISISMNDETLDFEMGIYVIIGLVTVPYFWFFWLAWNAPHRELRHRATAGAALTKDQARRLALDKISYGQLAGVAGCSLYFVWIAWEKHGGFVGGGRFWLCFAGLMMLVAVVQTVRKWRQDRT
ncbi:hypothetical protein [Sandarakinorhabdus oryzae]|uniref:hypothetical protein n=1 Tax=Sandarakinorhabdus oryzae TaxID=2675220 RepID=UPI0012E29609|nr:hypothetical protein [Sandarakinorhabdus oryzae]